MATYTITTTDDQETALVYVYGNIPPPPSPGFPGAPLPPSTQQEYLQQQVDAQVFNPMIHRYAKDVNEALVKSLASIPEENRDEALAAIALVVSTHGGEVVRTGEQPAPPYAVTLPVTPTPKIPPSFRSK